MELNIDIRATLPSLFLTSLDYFDHFRDMPVTR